MKTKQTLTILLTLLLSFGTWSCEKDEKEKNWTSLPAETQEGKNTIGCLVDGKVWATNYWGNIELFKGSMFAVYYKNRKNIGGLICEIIASKEDKSTIKIRIKSQGLKSFENFKANFSLSMKGTFCTSEKATVHLTKFDTINKIISGRFFVEAINLENKRDMIKVTDGRFDMELIIDKN